MRSQEEKRESIAKHAPASRLAPLVLTGLIAASASTLWDAARHQPGHAQPSKPAAAKPAAARPAPASKGSNVRIRNHPQGQTVFDYDKRIHRVTRNVVVTQDGEDFILYADELTHYELDEVATARKNLKVESRDSTITGGTLRADFGEKVITLTGNVVMRSHGSKDGIKPTSGSQAGGSKLRQEVLHKASVLRCDRIDYSYDTREAVLSGNIRMTQGANTGTCERIVFDEARNIAQMQGAVVFSNAKGQTMRTRNMTIWLDNSMVQSETRTTIDIPDTNDKPRAARTPVANFKPAPTLPPGIVNDPVRTPAPAPPAPRLEEDPEPEPAAPVADDAPEEANQEKAPTEEKAEPKPEAKPGE
jgi:lipopolysaccharide export system protein LptA